MEDCDEEIFAKGVGVKWENEPLHQLSTGQASNYNPRWWHQKPDLSSVPLQNNTCTAGYVSLYIFFMMEIWLSSMRLIPNFLFCFITNMAPWFRNLSYILIKTTFVLKSFCYSLIFSICRRLWSMLWRIWTIRGCFTSNSRIFFTQLNSHLPISAHLETKQLMECR